MNIAWWHRFSAPTYGGQPRVVVTGRLKQRSYETKEGEKRIVLEVEADDVSVSLKFAIAKVAKVSRSKPAAGNGQAETDPWASEAHGGYSEAPPF